MTKTKSQKDRARQRRLQQQTAQVTQNVAFLEDKRIVQLIATNWTAKYIIFRYGNSPKSVRYFSDVKWLEIQGQRIQL